MNPLRFALVTTFYPPDNFGGDGVFVERLARELARDGHEVDVIYDANAFEALGKTRACVERMEQPRLAVHPIRGGRFAAKADLLASHQLGRPVGKAGRLRRLFEEKRPDVIHFHNVSLMGGPGVLRYGSGIKLCTLHDYWFVCPMHVLWRFDREPCARRTCFSCTVAGGRPPQLWRGTRALTEALGDVDAFLAPSETSRRLHVENGFPAPIRVLPHFVPDPRKPYSAGPDPSPPPERPFFLYVGRLEKLKGVLVLLEQFRSYREADLVIAGRGTLEDRVREAARDLPHVRLHGWLPAEALDWLYREALAVVVPSLCYETFGLTVAEAFAAGTPAIVSAGGAAEELIASSGGGICYRSPADLRPALEELRTRPELRRKLAGQARRAFEERFTAARHLERYYALLDELASRKRLLA